MDYSLEPTWSPVSADELYAAARFAPKPDGFDETMNRIRANDPELTHLDLSNKGLSSWNAIELCDALATNTTLISLDVGNNPIGDAGNVGWNQIGADGARALASNTTLTSLDVSWNHLAPANILLLKNAINRNIIEAKKTILRLHAFASIANNYPQSPQFLPEDIVSRIGPFLTTDADCLTNVRLRAAVRSSRYTFHQPFGTVDSTIEPTQPASNNVV